MPHRFEDRHFVAVFAAVAALVLAPSVYDRATNPPVPYDPVRAAEIQRLRQSEDAAADAEVLHIAVIGDSYSGGSDMGGNGAGNWVAVADRLLRDQGLVPEWTRSAIGGNGYIADGDSDGEGEGTFEDRVWVAVSPQTELVIVFGSRNDPGRGDVEQAATEVFRKAGEIAPDAELLVIGVPWVRGRDAPLDYLVVRDQLRRAATAAGATFVDPIDDGWFGGDAATLIGSDGIHPTDAGHAYMAERIAAPIADLAAEA